MPEDRITAYLDELLEPAPAAPPDSPAPAEPPADTPANPGYRLVSLCGLRLLIPPAFGHALQPGAPEPGGLAPLDVRPAIFPPDHPAMTLGADARAGCRLPLPARGVCLWFETDEGRVDIDAAAIAWKQDTSTRPWLQGTVAPLKAAIIDPEALADCAGRTHTGDNDG